MSSHSLAEAQGRLAEPFDRALAGEEVVITREGHPAVSLNRIPPAAEPALVPGPVTAADIDRLRRHRVGRLDPGAPDAAELVRAMRDEGLF